MRIIVYGVGAVGGTVAAALARVGHDVVGIARGAQLAAIQVDGLTLRSPGGTYHTQFPCVGDPSEIDFRPDDAILLTMKTQDTGAALEALRAAGVTGQPIFCVQNGVDNERQALRLFPNVHGICVMLPCAFLKPGVVSTFVEPRFGMFDIGRAPAGSDAHDVGLAEALEAANIAGFVRDDVMASKYGKLIVNLTNIIEAALGPDADQGELPGLVRAEGKAVLAAAGITMRDVGRSDPRRKELIRVTGIDGSARTGGSTTQSLARGTGSIETDYLNGEIVMLGRLHGIATPLNDRLARLSARLLAAGSPPGDMTLVEISAEMGVG